MKTFIRSFLGASTAMVILVLINVYIIGNNSDQKENTQIEISNQLPVLQSAFSIPPQATNFVEAADKSVNAVVHIKTEINSSSQSYHDFFDPFKEYFNQERQNTYVAFGSGVVISSDGYIVTNNHVVENADKISVTFNNRQELKAELIGLDPTTDLALIKVVGNNLPFMSFGDSDALRVGEWVLAVGNPFNLTSTVTAGIVSAKARNINILGSNSSIESFIQTDAVVNRGNSGGALVNTSGELIGINAAIASHTGVYEGYSFAIPANLAKKVVEDLKKYGEIQRAYLGVQLRDIDAEFAEKLGLSNVEGVYVSGVVEMSGAMEAGIKKGDIIISVNKVKTNTFSELVGTIGQYRPGNQINVRIKRKNDYHDYNVILKNQNNTTSVVKSSNSFFNEELNVSLEKLSKLKQNELGISSGLIITEIKGGMLQRGGISSGFIITEVNNLKVNNKNDLEEALRGSNNRRVQLTGIYPNGMKVSYEFML
jgi:Do/DeqQ family serine protease